jgi:hypothetical protein
MVEQYPLASRWLHWLEISITTAINTRVHHTRHILKIAK